MEVLMGNPMELLKDLINQYEGGLITQKEFWEKIIDCDLFWDKLCNLLSSLPVPVPKELNEGE